MRLRDILTESIAVQQGQYILKNGNLFYVIEPNVVNGDVKTKAIVHLVDKMYRTEDGKIRYTRSKPVTTVGLTAEAKVLSPADAYREYKILSTPMSWGTK